MSEKFVGRRRFVKPRSCFIELHIPKRELEKWQGWMKEQKERGKSLVEMTPGVDRILLYREDLDTTRIPGPGCTEKR